MATPTETSPEAKEFAKAYSNLSDKVSVAGWKEALSEEVTWISHVFKTTLVIMTICCVYYSNQSMFYYFQHNGYKDEITDFPSEPSLPLSNVTICAQLYFNETYVRNRLNISKTIVQSYINQSRSGTSEDDFYRLLTLSLAPVVRMRERDLILENHLRKIVRSNPQLNDFSDFATSAYPSCEKMLKRCWINGQGFDCCRNVVQSVSDDGICYLIVLNMDNDNASPSEGTVHLNRSGPSGGLTIEAETELHDFPMLDSDADNGYSVFVDATPYTSVLSPAAAPSFSETHIKVALSKRALSSNCAARGRLTAGIHHDPEGYVQTIMTLPNIIQKYLACDVVYYMDRPNASQVCDPYRTLFLTLIMSVGDADIQKYTDQIKMTGGLGQRWLKEFWNMGLAAYAEVENNSKSLLSRPNSYVQKHCVRWSYETKTSFFDLKNDHPRKDIMYSRIRIYYGDLAYRQYEQVPEFTVYLQFGELSNLMGLYWGTSAVSFVHLIYYLYKYWWARRKWKRSVCGQRETERSRRSAQKERPIGKATKGLMEMRNIKVAPIIRSDSGAGGILMEDRTGHEVKYAATRNVRVSVISHNIRV